MFDFYDYSSARFLDSLADLYEKQGFVVQYLPFAYSVDFSPLGTGGTRVVEIGADADFVCTMFNGVVFDRGSGQMILGRMLVSITVDNNQRQLTNQPTTLQCVYGTGPRPGQLFKPLVLPANSTMTITLDNLDSDDRVVKLSHVGVKAFLAPAR